MLQKIKALRTFAAGKTIFYPYAKEPYIVNAESANAWEKSGHCKLIDGPFEPGKEADDTKLPEEPENAVNEQTEGNNADFEAMSYNELKEAGKKAKIANYNTMKKRDLIKALKGE